MLAGIRTLFILRHAKAEPGEGLRDEDRALTERGRRAASRVGELCEDRLPDRVLSSTALRTRETVAAFAKSSGYRGPVVYLPSLYLAEPAAYIDALRAHGADAARVLVVGHNPGLEDLVARLSAEHVSLPTAALVECTLAIGGWADVTLASRAEIVRVTYPREDE